MKKGMAAELLELVFGAAFLCFGLSWLMARNAQDWCDNLLRKQVSCLKTKKGECVYKTEWVHRDGFVKACLWLALLIAVGGLLVTIFCPLSKAGEWNVCLATLLVALPVCVYAHRGIRKIERRMGKQLPFRLYLVKPAGDTERRMEK